MDPGVPGEQDRLEEEQAGGPDRRGAAEQGQHHLPDHRLQGEGEKSAQEKRAHVAEKNQGENSFIPDPEPGIPSRFRAILYLLSAWLRTREKNRFRRRWRDSAVDR